MNKVFHYSNATVSTFLFFSSDDMPLVDSGVNSKYTCEVKCSDEFISSLINQSVGVNLLGQSVTHQSENGEVLVFKLSFAPSKAFRCVKIQCVNTYSMLFSLL